MMDSYKYTTTFFSELLEAHKLEASPYNGWVTVEGKFPAFRAFYERPQTANSSGTLSIQVMLNKDTLIEECFAAFGSSDLEAIKGALEQFAISMFHPIISACCNYVDDEHVTKETWKLKLFSQADIWCGNIATRSSSGQSFSIPTEWINHVSIALKKTKTIKGYNWMTLYCSRFNSEPYVASASINGSNWPSGLQATTNLTWPKVDGFYGARVFILAKT